MMIRWLAMFAITLGLLAKTDSDAAISSRIQAKLARSKLKPDGLRYSVKQGVVEWDGAVSIGQHKGAATRMAKAAGAARVVNRIVVKRGAHRGAGGTPAKAPPREVTVQVPKR